MEYAMDVRCGEPMTLGKSANGDECVRKMRAELGELESRGVVIVGNAFSSVLLVKGDPGEAERAGGELLSGKDGTALHAALQALGYAPEDWVAMATWGSRGEVLDSSLLRQAVAALDPATLVVCDDFAAEAVRNAFADDLVVLADFMDASLEPGRVVQVCGMRVLNLGGFEAALGSDHEKQVRWAWLKQIRPLAEPY